MDIINLKYAIFGLVIPIFLGLIFFVYNRKQKSFVKNIDKSLLKDVYPVSFKKIKIKQLFHFFIACLLFICILRPVILNKNEKVKTIKMDITIVLDISPSMMAKDILPDRLTRAKREIYSLLKYLPNYRVSLVLFSGQAMLQVPLTSDYSPIDFLLDDINIDYISSHGTDITDALTVSKRSLESSTGEGFKKMVLLITDGEDHSSGLSRVLNQYKKDHILVYCIGVGSTEGSPIPVYKDGKVLEYLKDKDGKVVMSKLDGSVLNNITRETGGKLYLVDQSTFNLRRIVDDIIKIEKSKSITETKSKDFSDLYQYFLFLAVLLIIITLIVSNKQGVLFVLLIIFFVGDLNYASPFNFIEWQNNSFGNNYFRKNETDRAVNKYMHNTRINGTNPITRYNLGNGLAVNGKIEEAEKEWQFVLDQSKNNNLKSKVYFNKGVSNIKQEDYSSARDMFINTLRLNHNDKDAKKNLEMVLMKIQQQKKQNQHQKNQKDKNDKDKNKKSNNDNEEKNQNLNDKNTKGKMDEKEAIRILDQYKNNKMFNPNKKKKRILNENNW